MIIQHFESRPQEVHAVQWGGDIQTAREIIDWVMSSFEPSQQVVFDARYIEYYRENVLEVKILIQPALDAPVIPGDWVIWDPSKKTFFVVSEKQFYSMFRKIEAEV